MWTDDYIGSLTLLPGTLAELGAKAGLGGVSFVEDGSNEWDIACVVSLVSSTLSILDSLEEEDFFLFLSNMSKIATELKSVLALHRQWKVTEITDRVKQTLAPIHSVLSRLAPDKAYWILLPMKDFLEEVQVRNWDREYCVELLNIFQEDLTDLQPRSCLNCLEDLRWLLVGCGQHLVWLASHPVIEKELGRPNLFDRLISIEVELEDALSDGDLLVALQEMLEELNLLQAIDLQE